VILIGDITISISITVVLCCFVVCFVLFFVHQLLWIVVLMFVYGVTHNHSNPFQPFIPIGLVDYAQTDQSSISFDGAILNLPFLEFIQLYLNTIHLFSATKTLHHPS
jgi:hypothetical protein